MSGTENQPDNPASDAPDNARKAQRPPSLGAELADSQRAEPMSREDYANFMRREPAADTGEDTGDDGNPANWSAAMTPAATIPPNKPKA